MTESTPWDDPAYVAERAAERLSEWAEGYPPDGEQVGTLTLTTSGGKEATVPLTLERLRALAFDLQSAAWERRHNQLRDARIEQMAELIVRASRTEADLGEWLAYCLHQAASKLYRPWMLIARRPGSWEAGIVEEMAEHGGRIPGDADLAQQMIDKLVEMGRARDDGGDVLAQALGRAARKAGGIEHLYSQSGRWWERISRLADPMA